MRRLRTSTDAEAGFGLIELLIVFVIIGILVAIAVPLYVGQRDKARDAAVKAGVRAVQVAVLIYATEHDDGYPGADAVGPGGVVASYLDPWPVNPWTGLPMRNCAAYSRGDFCYDAWSDEAVASTESGVPTFEHYGLVGWTSREGRPYVVRPMRSPIL